MKLKTLFSLLMLLMASGCRSGVQAKHRPQKIPLKCPTVRLVLHSSLPRPYRRVVTKALIIDNEKVVSTFRTLDSTQSDPDVVDTWNRRTDDGGIPFNKLRHPPALMLFC